MCSKVAGDCERLHGFETRPRQTSNFTTAPSTSERTSPFIMAANGAESMMQSGIFEDLQKKIDEDTQIKDVRTKAIAPRAPVPDLRYW